MVAGYFFEKCWCSQIVNREYVGPNPMETYLPNTCISKKVTLFVCSAVRVFVNQILASFSSLWPAVKPFT